MRKVLFLIFGLMACNASFAKASNITAVWANDGEDKVTQDDLRVAHNTNVLNSIWDGSKISIFGARNEVVAFNVILEAATNTTGNITVAFTNLTGPSGSSITSTAATGDGVFNWINRSIELFFVRYLTINGISLVSYDTYDERIIPKRLRRPWSGDGIGAGIWQDRPDHNKAYPEIAVPIELVPSFSITAGHNQCIWVDIYIPKTVPTGLYQGNFVVKENGATVSTIPVNLKVYNFTLPDTPNAKTMLYMSTSDISRRFFGSNYVEPTTAQGAQDQQIRDRYVQMAHRHRMSMIGDTSDNCNSTADQPCSEWVPRLNGNLFTATNGYAGPGVGVGNGVYSIGTFGSWGWQTGTQADMNLHTNNWATWFAQNSPSTEYFLYLDDESSNYSQTQTWAQWILSNPGIGSQVKSMATIPLPTAASQTPALDIPASTLGYGIASQWQPLVSQYTTASRQRFYMYNGHRPASGCFATEDDGVALRELAWVHYKEHVNRWFYWDATYYNNYQGGMGDTDLFNNAQTFGTNSSVDSILGQTGWNYGNGDGVLLYPGTDKIFSGSSYGVNGPMASLRMKAWRRGIQDVDYLTMAASISPSTVQVLVSSMVPKALWEYGVTDPNDPTYVRTDISWSINPDNWEMARQQLAMIIAPPQPATVTLSPGNITLATGKTQPFTATAVDQFGQPITSGVSWAATGGSISSQGLFTAGLTPGTYTVTAQIGSAKASVSVTINTPVAQGTISPPTSIAFTNAGLTTLQLAWNAAVASLGVAGYRLDLATDSGFLNGVSGYSDTDEGNVLSIGLTGLQSGTTYYARVRAYDSSGDISANSVVTSMRTLNPTVSVPPGVPANVTWNQPTLSSLLLSWVPPSSGSAVLSRYQVQVSTLSDFSNFANQPTAGFYYSVPVTNAVLSGLFPNTGYYARIRAMDVSGAMSDYTLPLYAMTLGGTMIPPASINLTNPGITTLDLSWSPGSSSLGVSGYRVDLATDPGFTHNVPSYTNADEGNVLSVTLRNLQAGTSYYARVRAYDYAADVSANSPVASLDTLSADYVGQSAPVDVTLYRPTISSLLLSWEPSSSTSSITASSFQAQISTLPDFSDLMNQPSAGFFYSPPTTNAVLSGLAAGTQYYARVRAMDRYGNTSAYSATVYAMTQEAAGPATGTSIITTLANARVRPNPWRADRHNGFPMTFDQLIAGSTVKIFTVSGFLVKTLSALGNSVTWDLTNNSGDRVASGLYLYLVTNGPIEKSVGKLAVIR